MHERTALVNTGAGFSLFNAICKINVAWARAQMGQTNGAVERIREGLAELNAFKFYSSQTWFLCLLCETQVMTGAIDEALVTVEQALQPNHDELIYRPEAFRLRADLHLKEGAIVRAMAGFRQAIGLARRIAAKSDELRATTSSARMLAKQNKRNEARKMVARIYGWFSQGFDIVDLKDARALLDELKK
jgi:predicted ATPase